MTSLPTLETLNDSLATALLLLVWVLDVKDRRVPNLVWFVAAPVLLVSRALLGFDGSWLPFLAWGVAASIVAVALWVLHWWGGADAKGIMVLAWGVPAFQFGERIVHPLLYAVPLALLIVASWQRWRPGAKPFYAALSPVLIVLVWFV